VPSLGSGTYPFARLLISSAGLDPDKDVKWLAVGVGPQAALALDRGQIQALSLWDTMQAALEGRGMKFRIVASPAVDNLIGQLLVARKEFLEQHPETAIAIARGIAEATIYAAAYPEATIQNHWKLFPQSEAQKGTLAEKLQDAKRQLNARLDLMIDDDWPRIPFGEITPTNWSATVDAAIKDGTIKNRERMDGGYTNRLIKQINEFDKAEVLQVKFSGD
jgi:NitT/TauT family transport system substrate-binding protein